MHHIHYNESAIAIPHYLPAWLVSGMANSNPQTFTVPTSMYKINTFSNPQVCFSLPATFFYYGHNYGCLASFSYLDSRPHDPTATVRLHLKYDQIET